MVEAVRYTCTNAPIHMDKQQIQNKRIADWLVNCILLIENKPYPKFANSQLSPFFLGQKQLTTKNTSSKTPRDTTATSFGTKQRLSVARGMARIIALISS